MPSAGGGSSTTAAWSPSAQSVWGKTDRSTHAWLPLVQHLEDAAGVAGHLWDHWLPDRVKGRLSSNFGSPEAARSLVIWLAGIHDVGKATPAFAVMGRDVGMGDLVDAMERHGLAVPHLPRQSRPHHSVTGHLAVQSWLCEQHGWTPTRASALASVVGGHHGTPPTPATLDAASGVQQAWGEGAWQVVRREVLDGMALRTDVLDTLASLSLTKLPLTALVDLSALVIVADWLASDAALFPYLTDRPTGERLADGVAGFDLPAPWKARRPESLDVLFRARFPHLKHVEPNTFQLASVSAAQQADSPPLVLIEAPTGSGKSEAALMVAEALAAEHGCGGVFVALPTMATSDAMFDRVLAWVQELPELGRTSIYLAHGKASLNESFAGVVKDSRIAEVYDEDTGRAQDGTATEARVSSWLNGRKRGLLANFVIGTIDQVLMAGLKTRHLALRHLALSGKVVIVDEVHAADDYMRAYLCTVLGWLGAYGTPVVLLSATLPPAQREELVTAYLRGRDRRSVRPSLPASDDYPLVTTVASSTRQLSVPPDAATRDVVMETCRDDLLALVDNLRLLLEGGGCVGIIRNTVARAQETYDVLRTAFGDEVELVHSRFMGPHRIAKEKSLRSRLGPPGSGERPRRLLLVGTQVLEQSLDIDLDLLVTDLAPVDLLLQRIGRLHRHSRDPGDRPPALRSPRCLVTGVVDWVQSPPEPVRGSTAVYGEGRLLRAAAVLSEHLDVRPVGLPAEVPALVRAGYDPALLSPQGWDEAWSDAGRKDAERRRDQMHRSKSFRILDAGRLATLVNWMDVTSVDTEGGSAQVRDSEDGIEVILVVEQGDTLMTLPGTYPGSGRVIPATPDDRDRLTRQVLACTVRLPHVMTLGSTATGVISALEQAAPVEGWQQSRWLQGQLVLPLSEDLTTRLAGFDITYSAERGLTVNRNRAKDDV